MYNRAVVDIQNYYPGIRLYGIVYAKDFPKTIKPHDNLVILYCGISCENHILGQEECFEKGGQLHKYVDIAIDCHVPYGDACLSVGDAAMGGLSTYTACFILNTCLIEGAKLALERGAKPPVYLSGNVEGGRDHNVVLEELYLGRVKHL